MSDDKGVSLFESLDLLQRSDRVVMVADIVGSVALIERDDRPTILRWLNYCHRFESEVIDGLDGRIAKSLGDGLLIEFGSAREAVAAALAIQDLVRDGERDQPFDRRIRLRVGIEAADILALSHDIFGHGVNLAARLAGIAGPDEIVLSQSVRDRIVDLLDADIYDLGLCHLKNVSEPVRAFRVGHPGMPPASGPGIRPDALAPRIGVLPFISGTAEPQGQMLGEIVADDLIERLSKSSSFQVISRQSTAVFAGRDAAAANAFDLLDVAYIVSGRTRRTASGHDLLLEVADRQGSAIILADTLALPGHGDKMGFADLVDTVARNITSRVFDSELRRARLWPMETLETHTILLAAIGLMHRNTPQDFQLCSRLISELLTRAPRHPIPRAWMAYWHVTRVHQGWSEDTATDGEKARDYAESALDIDPTCDIALVTNGLVNTQITNRFDVALDRYEAAVNANPNFSLGWLLKGAMHAFMDNGAQAVADTVLARRLSPLDPQKYYYDSLSSTAALAAGEDRMALQLADRSLKANRLHNSTLRVKLVAECRLGDQAAARTTFGKLSELEPGLTVSGWLSRSPAAEFPMGREFAGILRQMGVPES